MAKVSTTVIKKDTRQAEIKSKGVWRLDENGRGICDDEHNHCKECCEDEQMKYNWKLKKLR